MDYRNRIKGNIWKLYAYWFFHNFIFAYVIERLYWQQRGMTIQQVVYTEIIYAGVIIILEIPTGVISDRWSRKNMLVIGAFLTCFEFIILIYANSFWHFALAVGVAGVSSALCSGTSNALLYDSLKVLKRQDEFEKILGRVNFFDYGASFTAALLGGLTAVSLGFVSNYWLSLVSVIISFIVALSLVEPEIKTVENESTSFSYAKDAIIFLKDHKIIRFVLLTGIIMGSAMNFVDEFWQLYADNISIPVIYFGIISSVDGLIISIFSLVAFKIKKHISYRYILLGCLILVTLGLLIMSFAHSFLAIFILMILSIGIGVSEPLISGYLHNKTESYYRATVESFQSLSLRITIIIVGLFFGYMATKGSIIIGFRFLGFFCLAYLVYYIYNMRQLKE